MRKFFLLICLSFMPFLIFSQETKKKSDSASTSRIYLDVSGGISLPMGSFAKSDLENSGSGFATQGFLAQVNLDWIGKSDYGLAVQYTFQRNPLKSSVKKDTLSGMNEPLGTGAWTSHYLMAGIVVMKFIHKVYIEGRALIGVILSTSPVFNTIDPLYKTEDSNTGTGFAYGIQLGAGYAVSPRVCVKANIEYLVGNPAIHHQYGAQVIGVDTTTGRFIYSAPITYETKRTISALLLKAGIVIKLSK
jgi:opacity protein-like surface antigen